MWGYDGACVRATIWCIEIGNYSTINLFKPQKETFASSAPRRNGNTAISHWMHMEFLWEVVSINFL